MRPLARCVFAVVLAVGCGDNAEIVHDEVAVDLSLVPDRISAAMCGRIFDCCDAAEIDAIFGVDQVADEADCRESGAEILVGFYARVADAVNDGAIDYDEEAAADCVRVLAAMSCEQYSAAPSPQTFRFDGCVSPFTPRSGVGAQCETDLECTSSFCERVGADGGTCQPVPGRDDPCPSFRCADGLYCGDSGVCADKKPDAAACVAFEECASGACLDAVADGAPGVCGAQAVCDGA